MRSSDQINNHLSEARAEAGRRTARADALEQQLDEVSRAHRTAARDHNRPGCAAAEAAYEDYRAARQADLTQRAVVRALEEEATAAGPELTTADVTAAEAEADRAEQAWIQAEDSLRDERVAAHAGRPHGDLDAANERAQQAYHDQRVARNEVGRVRDALRAQRAWRGIDADRAWEQQARIDREQNWQTTAA